MTQSNKIIVKSIFFILVLFNLCLVSTAQEIVLDNVTLKFSEEKPLIESIHVKTENLNEQIAENIEFFILNSEYETESEILLKKEYKGTVLKDGIKYEIETKKIKAQYIINPNENNLYNVDFKITSKVENLDLSKYFFTLKPGLNTDAKYGKAIFYKNGEDVDDFKFKNKAASDNFSSPEWVAFTNQYYVFSVIYNNFSNVVISNVANTKSKNTENSKEEEVYYQQIKLKLPSKTLDKGSAYETVYSGYIGEKRLEKLEKVKQIELLDLGFFGGISKYFLMALKAIKPYTGNWGWSIMLLTLLIKLILYPLNIAQAKSMANMQKLQPKINEIKTKFKNDSQKMNVEIMELYKKHNVNPFGGCFPILIQLPILFALFTMLRTSIEIKGASFYWLLDLAKPDPLYIMPVLIAASMYFQQKSMSSATSGNQQQQQMMVMMPFIMLVVTISLPSGVLLYWFVSNLLAIVQQVYVNKHIYGGEKK